MSHHAFAALWTQLELRTDIDNILCELIGRNSLESSLLPNDSDELLDTTLHLAVFLRVVFDLQRTYLQGPRPESQCHHLLQPTPLLFAIVYLLRIKSRVFCRPGDNLEHYVIKRSFVAQTLISGLRALWLWRHPFPQSEITQLGNVFTSAWENDPLNGHDVFLVRILCPKIIEELAKLPVPLSNDPPSDHAYPACRQIQLRDYSTGLYPLESRTDDLIRPVREASQYLNPNKYSDKWFKNYWILFDIAWSTEAALIQLCINASRARGAKVDQGDLDQLYNTRRKVLETIHFSKTIERILCRTVDTILFGACYGQDCTCLEDLRTRLTHPAATSTQLISMEFPKIGKLNLEMNRLLDHSLAVHTKVLENRREELRDCNGELTGLSESLDLYMDAWYSDISPIEAMDNTSRHARRTAYIIPCPNLHPIPYENLENLIKQSQGQVGLQELRSNSTLLDVDIACDQCGSEHRIRKARQIEPLRRLSTMIREKLRLRPLFQREIPSRSIYTEHLERNYSGTSSSTSNIPPRTSTGSNRTSLSEKGTTRTGPLTDFFDEPPRRSRFVSYCFSADGNSVLLWEKAEAHIALYDINTTDVDKFTASYVTFAAAGAKYFAFISQDRNGRNIYAHRRQDDEPFDKIGSNVRPVYCIVVSRDDKYIAVGFDGEAWIYVIESRQICRHKFDSIPDKNVDSQRISFSSDSEQIIIATRYREGIVCTYVGECTNPMMGSSLTRVKIATGNTNDCGLSSVLYDSNSSYAFVAAFSLSKPPVLIPRHGAPILLDTAYSDRLGTQIQCAASSPSGQIFTLVNHKNVAFSVQWHANGGANGRWSVETLKTKVDRKTASTKANLMAAAMPDENTIHLFWINDAKWTLMII